MLYAAEKNVPSHLGEIIWDSLIQTSAIRTTIDTELSNKLAAPPCLEEFEKAIKFSPSISAPGPSGLSYQHMKLWTDVTVRWVHRRLCDIWSSHSVPEFWKNRILHPLTKDPSKSGLDNLRPIMLLESLRKLWSGMAIRIIAKSLESHRVLATSQYGFRNKRSTAQAILQVINALEEAHEEGSPAFVTSWDIAKAFDSVPKSSMLEALLRVGVPSSMSQWLCSLDKQDCTMVNTPWASQSKSTLPTHNKFADPNISTLTAAKGTGQGDVTSPLIWILFFDILLRALATETRSHFWIRSRGDHLHPVQDTAYADDLLSITPTLDSLQQKADIVSAFTVLFHLKIATSKLRTLLLNLGSEYPGDGSDNIIIHGPRWTPSSISLSVGGEFTYLGALVGDQEQSKEAFQRTAKKLSSMTTLLSIKRAPPGLVSAALYMVLVPKIRYPSLLLGPSHRSANWTNLWIVYTSEYLD